MSDDKKTRLLEDLDNVRQRITELEESEQTRAETEKNLREDSERYRHAVDTAPLSVMSVDVQGKLKYANSQLLKKFKLPSPEGNGDVNVMSHTVFKDSGLSAAVRRCLETQKQNVFEKALEDQNGHQSWFRHFLNPILDKDGSINGVLAVIDDVSEYKSSQKQLTARLSVEQNTNRVLSRLVGVFDIDQAVDSTLAELGEVGQADRAFLFLVYEKGTKMDNTHEWCAKGVNSHIEKLQNLSTEDLPWWKNQLETGASIIIHDVDTLSEGAKAEKAWLSEMEVRSLIALPVRLNGQLTGLMGLATVKKQKKWEDGEVKLLKTVADVVGEYLDKKRTDDVQREREERFSRLAQASIEGLFILQEGLIMDSNHAAGTLLDFKPSEFQGQAFVSLIEDKARPNVEKYLREARNTPFETEIRKKTGLLVPVELQTRSIMLQDIPVTVVALRDISDRKKLAAAEQKKSGMFEDALGGSIRALSRSLALRDPFAAGHGEGVAKLAAAIAKEMGFSEDKIEGLHLTGSVHDIGKISLPAEILSKPGKISDAERTLVETHPKTGFEILKDIKLPWPVAQIVLQHHERMNGTGYPAGISGENILLEARILAVADTLDAMVSERSYRPAHSLASAVEEITKNKGTLYDPKVVDAAVKVINQRSYPFKS
ncbi:MAG: HD domain-containing phosphohydrolase [Candidatus Aminicenantaceae bacterium]